MEHDMEHDMEPPSHYSFIAHYSINVSLLARIKVPKGYLYGTIRFQVRHMQKRFTKL